MIVMSGGGGNNNNDNNLNYSLPQQSNILQLQTLTESNFNSANQPIIQAYEINQQALH